MYFLFCGCYQLALPPTESIRSSGCELEHLDLGDWSLLNPRLDLLQLHDVVERLLQAGVLLHQVGLGHVVQVVDDAREVEVGPGELAQRQVAAVLLGDHLQLLQVERNDLVVQRHQLLLLDIIIGLVRHDGDLCGNGKGERWEDPCQ